MIVEHISQSKTNFLKVSNIAERFSNLMSKFNIQTSKIFHLNDLNLVEVSISSKSKQIIQRIGIKNTSIEENEFYLFCKKLIEYKDISFLRLDITNSQNFSLEVLSSALHYLKNINTLQLILQDFKMVEECAALFSSTILNLSNLRSL